MTKVYTHNTVLAAALFSIGLILVCNFGFFLYTGKICYLLDELIIKKNKGFVLELIVGLIFNILGATLMGVLLRNFTLMADNAGDMMTLKNLDANKWLTLLKGIFCGLLINLAVEGYRKSETSLGKYLILVLCVAGFIVCGFEHSIADDFYFAVSGFEGSLVPLLLIILGNTIGGLIYPLLNMIILKTNKEKM
jgi:formate/nitrite transporter FocA (FNT family)